MTQYSAYSLGLVEDYATAGKPVFPVSDGGACGGSGTSRRVFSAIILWNPIPTPSITARRHAHPIAEFRAAFAPPLIARAPPVKNPAMTVEFCQHWSKPSQPTPMSYDGPNVQRTGIIWILLLSYSLHCTVKRREQPTPDTKVSS